MVGELVIAQSLVTQDGDVRSLQSPQLMRHLAQLGRITAELQKTATSLRMVPIKSTFEKMTRLVRDLSLKAGKQVELQFSGEETELDRNLIEELDDPLVHMIRNAVDHGIEKPDVRVAKGKPARGVVQLRAFHQGGNILIEIKDDGAGLNPERLLAKARQQGLAAEGETLSESEIFRFIFAPGFSTAEKITEISGRGVGMDVVRRNIANLRGKIEIASILNQGSAFTIYLPLTLAIIDGLLVGVGDQRFILPTLSVRESFRPTPAMISTVHQRGEMVNVRGRLCPLLRLHRHFDIAPQTEDPAQAIIIVLESNHELRCLMVDQLLGKQEVVIKSLGETFKASHALAGAAILGDGRVGLILDVNNLIHLGNGTFNGTAAPVHQEVAALA
jgi:two-component system chemotaxis sensor kinase CheA